MATVGYASLILALAVCLYGAFAAVYGVRRDRQELVVSARRAAYALALLLTVAIVLLEVAFIRSDFGFRLVVDSSSTTTPNFYKLTAMWSSQAGSLLLWAWLLSLFTALALYTNRNRLRDILPYANAVLLVIAAFFCFLTIFYDNPFALVAQQPVEGNGLNPLLRHPSMMFHPPALYLGYVAISIPFAFAIGSLISGREGTEWLSAVRTYALVAWAFLTVGVLLGARWSYAELGWGGYWAWDAVENASLMPWLTGTAFLHTVIVQQRRGIFKVWNMALVIATFLLALLATFLVRSGIISSIHAFGASSLGVPFLIFIVAALVFSIGLLAYRFEALRPSRTIDSLLSRESIFLVNNLLLVGLCFVILWGTFFPLISEALTGQKSSLGPPWFNQFTMPLAILLVLMSGVGPLLAWGGMTWKRALRLFITPGVIAAVVVVALLVFGVTSSVASFVLFAFAAFAISAIAGEFWRGSRARQALAGSSLPVAFVSLIRRNRRRYGGYLVHIGVVVLLVGVAASSAFQESRDVQLRPGGDVKLNGYEFSYVKPTASVNSERLNFGVLVDVRRGGKRVALLNPSRNYYPSLNMEKGSVGRFFRGESTSEVALQATALRDIWTAAQPDLKDLRGPIREANRRFPDADGTTLGVLISAIAERYRRSSAPVTLRIIVSPMVTWIWIGGLIVLVGALVAAWPAGAAGRRRTSALAAARLGRELSKA